MKRKTWLRILIYLLVFGVICKYEYQLYKKVKQENSIRIQIIDKNTKEIKKSFTVRDDDFYKNKEYEKSYKKRLENLDEE